MSTHSQKKQTLSQKKMPSWPNYEPTISKTALCPSAEMVYDSLAEPPLFFGCASSVIVFLAVGPIFLDVGLADPEPMKGKKCSLSQMFFC